MIWPPIKHIFTDLADNVVQTVENNSLFQHLSSCVYAHRFSRGEIENSLNMPYRLYVPDCYNISGDDKYPIILVLHGAGKRGTDNRKQIYSSAVFYTNDHFQDIHPCFVLAPQCPTESSWVDLNSWGEGSHPLRNITPPLQTSIQLLDDLCDEYRIDTKKQFVTGFSMGGYGTWEAIIRFPNRFAAAIPISGGGIPEAAGRLDSVRVWAFHGAKDTTVPVSGTRQMIKSMQKKGLNPRYTEFQTQGHTASPVFNQDGLVEWLFHTNGSE